MRSHLCGRGLYSFEVSVKPFPPRVAILRSTLCLVFLAVLMLQGGAIAQDAVCDTSIPHNCDNSGQGHGSWHIQFDSEADRVMHLNGNTLRGNFATRAEAEAYWRSRPAFDRKHSWVVGSDDTDSNTNGYSHDTVRQPVEPNQNSTSNDASRQSDFEERKNELLNEMHGHSNAAYGTGSANSGSSLGLKTGRTTTSTGSPTTNTNPLGLKRGSTPVQVIDPEILRMQEGIRSLRIKVPPPLPDTTLSFENRAPGKDSPWLLNLGDYVMYAWSVEGRIGGKVLPWTNVFLVTGKVIISGSDGAELYLIGQDRLYENAARYLKNPATARKFARLVQNLRLGRPVPASTDPAMLRAAKAILDPTLNHTNPLRITWDLLMTPEAKMAMVRQAVFEAGMYMLGEGTEGIVGTLTRRGEVFQEARIYRNLARRKMKTAASPAEQQALKKIIDESDALLTDIYKDQQAIPKTASYVEGLIIPGPKAPASDSQQ